MLTDGERLEAELVAERMRERYRQLRADEAYRQWRVEQAAKRVARERLIDLHGMDAVEDSADE